MYFLNSHSPFLAACCPEDPGVLHIGERYSLQRLGRGSCNWMTKVEVLCDLKTLCNYLYLIECSILRFELNHTIIQLMVPLPAGQGLVWVKSSRILGCPGASLTQQ